MSTVTGRAPSPALQTFQEISGETRLLQAQGFQRSSPYPHLPGPRIPRLAPASGAERRGWTLRGSEKPAPGKMQSRDARRTSPPAAGPVWGLPAGSEAPYGRNPAPSLATPAPSRQLGWGSGRGSLALPSPEPNFRQQTSQSVLQGKRETKAPREKPHPRGTRGGDSPPPSAPGFSGWGSEEPHCRPRATAVPGAGAAHNRWSAPTGKPARVSVHRAPGAPVPSPAPARAQAAAGAPLSRRRALGPSTGDLRLLGPTPASLFAQPCGTPRDIYMR